MDEGDQEDGEYGTSIPPPCARSNQVHATYPPVTPVAARHPIKRQYVQTALAYPHSPLSQKECTVKVMLHSSNLKLGCSHKTKVPHGTRLVTRDTYAEPSPMQLYI